jgi:hypothetical protein
MGARAALKNIFVQMFHRQHSEHYRRSGWVLAAIVGLGVCGLSCKRKQPIPSAIGSVAPPSSYGQELFPGTAERQQWLSECTVLVEEIRQQVLLVKTNVEHLRQKRYYEGPRQARQWEHDLKKMRLQKFKTSVLQHQWERHQRNISKLIHENRMFHPPIHAQDFPKSMKPLDELKQGFERHERLVQHICRDRSQAPSQTPLFSNKKALARAAYLTIKSVRVVPDAGTKQFTPLIPVIKQKLQTCYDQSWVRNPTLRGTTTLRITFNNLGKVMKIHTSSEDIDDPELSNCYQSNLKGLQLSSVPEGNEVEATFSVLLD